MNNRLLDYYIGYNIISQQYYNIALAFMLILIYIVISYKMLDKSDS